jgi:hypothetical protein
MPVTHYDIDEYGNKVPVHPADPMPEAAPGPQQSKPKRRKKRRAGPSTTQLSGEAMERTLIIVLQLAAWLLIFISMVGTFYGVGPEPAPLWTPRQIWIDVTGSLLGFSLAVVGQSILSVAQWGSRNAAKRDRRWWFAYLAVLAPSVWWNWEAYGPPLTDVGVPWAVALGIILLGDVGPELVLVRTDE